MSSTPQLSLRERFVYRIPFIGMVLAVLILSVLNIGGVYVMGMVKQTLLLESAISKERLLAMGQLEMYLQSGDEEALARFRSHMATPLQLAQIVLEFAETETLDVDALRELDVITFEAEKFAHVLHWHNHLQHSSDSVAATRSAALRRFELTIELDELASRIEDAYISPPQSEATISGLSLEYKDLRARWQDTEIEHLSYFYRVADHVRDIVLITNALIAILIMFLIGAASLLAIRRSESLQVQTKARLATKRQAYQTFVESTVEAIFVVDPATLTVVDCNQALCAMLGYSEDELVGMEVPQFVAHEHEIIDEMTAKLEAEGRLPVMERVWRTKTGELLHIEVTANAIRDAESDRDMYFVVARDVTMQKKVSVRLLEMERMAAVGTLAAGVGHEINNPLAYISANLDFSLRVLRRKLENGGADDPLLQEMCEALEEAREGALRVRDIVRDLKTFSRSSEDEKSSALLHDVIDSAVNMAWNQIRDKARLVKDYGPEVHVRGQESRLAQVFLNLLVNAAQAIDAENPDTEEIKIVTRVENERVFVEIHDTGCGVSKDHLPVLFEPFFTTKASKGGTGLGLPICRNIVESTGGTLEVSDTSESGTTMSLTLKRTTPGSADESLSIPVLMPQAEARVLIIDDEPRVITSLRRVLDKEIQVVSVTRARQALDLLAEGEWFDAIFCDLMMPEMSGMEFFAALEAEHPGQTERVIFISGGAFTAQAKSFVASMTNEFIEKPFDVDRVHRVLARTLDGVSSLAEE